MWGTTYGMGGPVIGPRGTSFVAIHCLGGPPMLPWMVLGDHFLGGPILCDSPGCDPRS